MAFTQRTKRSEQSLGRQLVKVKLSSLAILRRDRDNESRCPNEVKRKVKSGYDHSRKVEVDGR